jgi:hypothetical protein
MDAVQVIDFISKGGMLVALLYAIYGGSKGKWVFGWQYQEALDRIENLEAQVERWQNIATGAQEITDRSMAVSSELLRQPSRRKVGKKQLLRRTQE